VITPADLRVSPVLADLADGDLAWLAGMAQELVLRPGDVLAREGDPADAMYLVIDGEVQYRQDAVPDAPVFVSEPGELTGVLPFSRMEQYKMTLRALEPTRLARWPRERFGEMMDHVPGLEPRLVAALADRVREATRIEQQRDKLLSLGRLAAGLAHELNNPASAVRRGAAHLRERMGVLPAVTASLAGCNLNPAQFAMLAALQAAKLRAEARPALSSLEASAREDEVGAWLEAHRVPGAWELAGTFVHSDVSMDELRGLEARLPRGTLADAIVWLGSGLAADRVLRDVEEASARISALVAAVKDYTFMDQAPGFAETDVHAGLESTLTMLGPRLRERELRVERDYATDLPRPWASPGDLNQVWTNLMENALAACPRGGRIQLRTFTDEGEVRVQIRDDGPGIPEALLDRIWEPFFTTHDVGGGLGLGLDIVRRIVVRQHGGQVLVRSRPGDTCFEVRLPIQPALSPARDEASAEPASAAAAAS
jgi:signal transduction histidine kinase